MVLCWDLAPSIGMAAPPLEYCGTRKSDQRLGAASPPERNRAGQPHADCTPFIESKTPDAEAPPDTRKPARPPRDLKIENLPVEVSKFLQEYRQFLDCCKTDPAELARVEELGDEVGDLLRLAQTELFSEQMKLRGMTLNEMISPVASARRDLGMLHKKLEQLGALMEKRDAAEFEEAGRETLAIEETEETLQKGLRPHHLPSGAKTGI
jgi:hypothetical protein